MYLQRIDPAGFARPDAFREQMDFLHACEPIDPHRPVRLPGEQANARSLTAFRLPNTRPKR